MGSHISAIAAGLIAGTVARLYTLRIDYRNFPGYPQGYVTHLSIGFIASFLGAVAVPALLERNYTAVSFLALAAQELRQVRDIERKSLEKLDELELVKHGPEYIEGIAKVFEARNYLALIASLATSAAWTLFGPWQGIVAAVFGLLLNHVTMRGKRIGDIAEVHLAKLHFEGPGLYVDDIYIMNAGLPAARDTITKLGLGAIIKPKDENAVQTIGSVGQRQAIAHDVTRMLGTRKDISIPEFTPMARRSEADGRVGLFVVPMEYDPNLLIQAIKLVPVIESARGTVLKSRIGRKAAD